MAEHVRAILAPDEAVPFGVAERHDRAFHHSTGIHFMSVLRLVSQIPAPQTAVHHKQRQLASFSLEMSQQPRTRNHQVRRCASIEPACRAASSTPTSTRGTRQLEHPHQGCKRSRTRRYRRLYIGPDYDFGHHGIISKHFGGLRDEQRLPNHPLAIRPKDRAAYSTALRSSVLLSLLERDCLTWAVGVRFIAAPPSCSL